MTTATLSDDDYPTPPARILARLAELPLAAVGWTIDRLLGRRSIRRALRRRHTRGASRPEPNGSEQRYVRQ